MGSELMIKGTSVSTGIAHGTAFVLACSDRSAALRRSIEASEVEREVRRFEAALDRAEQELLALKQEVTEKIGSDQGDVFAAQALVVRDPTFHKQVETMVREKLVNAEWALVEVVERYTRSFDKISDAYLRERAADIRDVGRRMLSALLERGGSDALDVPGESIVVSDELLPSVTARLELNQAVGFVTEHGGKFSHGAILARSMGTPAVTGVGDASDRIKTGDEVVVDGVSGVVFVNPGPRVRGEYKRLAAEIRAYKKELQQLVDLPSVTADGTVIPLLANVTKFPDTEAAFLYRADGIGLYRTEFGFSIRSAFPTEDEQYEFLERAAARFHPRKVVFRLLDIGGDKTLPYFPLPMSRNPELAERGIRLLLKHPHVLEQQLRAFLRVSADHPIAILLPVVGGVEEVRETKVVLRRVQEELAAQGTRFNPNVPLGVMIEVPSAALVAEALAREVDFFSLGTNDLVQYLLAADREDESVAPYYQPLHPAVLRLIHSLVETAHRTGRGVTICGEMAGDPFYSELLVGLGLREFSVAPGEMLAVKNAIRKTRLSDATALAREALTLGSVAEISALLEAASR